MYTSGVRLSNLRHRHAPSHPVPRLSRHADRHLARGVVGDRPRVRVVRPELHVVVVRAKVGDLVFRLDVAVLGRAHVDADSGLVDNP